MSANPIIYNIASVADFKTLVENNTGVLVVKYGASWCGPCKTIEPILKQVYSKLPSNVQVIVVDIDDCMEVYSFMKNKRMLNGVPALTAYVKGNTSHVPDYGVTGADIPRIQKFFERVYISASVL
jgi:thioredoxin 1